MHERELKVLWRGGALLAFASVARLVAGGPVSGVPLASPSVLDSLLVASRTAQEASARGARTLEPGERIDPNTADATELSRLPGIGPALAERIVLERSANGPFASIADLARVAGIGARSIERLSPALDLGPRTTSSPPPSRGARQRAEGAAIDLNRATATELVGLKGVGPVLAERIVRFRDQHGAFGSPAELLNIPGIGPARLREIEAALAPKGGSPP